MCRICRVCRTKKIHRTDRIHSISYKTLYLSLLYWAVVREVSIKLYLSYEFFSYDRHDRYDRYNDMETRLKEVHSAVVQTGIVFPKGTVKFGFSQFFLFLIFCLVVCWLVCLSAVRVESNDFLFQIFLEWCNWSASALNQKTGFLSGQKMFLFRVSRLQVYTVLLAVYLKIIDIK